MSGACGVFRNSLSSLQEGTKDNRNSLYCYGISWTYQTNKFKRLLSCWHRIFFCLFCFSVEEEKHCYPNCHNFNLNYIDAYTCKHIYLHILYAILGSHSLIPYGFSNILNVAYPHFYLWFLQFMYLYLKFWSYHSQIRENKLLFLLDVCFFTHIMFFSCMHLLTNFIFLNK